jgi:YegS/Rv2252/BmrU family lipid kinase
MGRFKIGAKELEDRFKETAIKLEFELDMEIRETHFPGDAEKFSRKDRNSRFDTIVACGGDGTIYEIVNGIAGSGKALGVIPLGSGNDGIVSITGKKRSVEDCMEDIIKGVRRPIDIARMNERLFLNVVGVGMDAAINHEVADRRDLVKKFGPTFQYTYCTFRVIPRWKDMHMRITMDDGEPREQKVKMLTIGNGTVCGGGFRLTPRAKLDDGLLDLSLIKTAGILRTMVSVPKAFKGKHLDLDIVEYKQFRKLKVECLEDRELPLHIDGEKGFSRNLEFEVVRNKMWTVHPHIG